MKTRFAPSPTGFLHRGHAMAAFHAFNFTKKGTCLLRIEDIDHTRCRGEFTQAIYQDLHWLGFNWPEPVRIQSQHREAYLAVTTHLVERGLVYPCALSRTDVSAGQIPSPQNSILKPPTKNIIAALKQASEADKPQLPWNIRLNLDESLKQIEPDALNYTETGQNPGQIDAYAALAKWATSSPDPIIARRDIASSYHIAVTHDDAVQNITHVVRGADLADQTPLHVLIQNLLGWPVPTYHHHGLILGPDGRKLSKTSKSETLQALRANGLSPKHVLDSLR